MLLRACVLLFLLPACRPSTDVSDADPGDTAGATDTDEHPDGPWSTLTATVVDLQTSRRLGSSVTFAGVTGETVVGEGIVTLEVPSFTEGWLTLDARGYLPQRGWWVQEGRPQYYTWFEITASGASMLLGLFGASFSEDDALVTAVAVTPTASGTIVPLEGVTFDLDVPYALALSASTTGSYAPGNTTGDSGVVVFPGVAPGDVTLSVAAPQGTACVNWIAKDARSQTTTYALEAGVNTLIWYCAPI